MKTPLLIADLDFGEIVKILFIVFIALAAGLMKLFSGVKPAGQKPGGGPAAVPPRPAPTDALNNEIDEFLRRAAQRRQRQQSRGAEAVRPPRESVIRQGRAVERPVEAEVISARPVGGEVEKHLQKFAAEKKEFEERAARLGGEVAQADDKVAAHLKEKFTHQLGQLERRLGETAASPSPAPTGFAEDQIPPLPATAAAGFAALLMNAPSLRQAIVLSEILPRPMDRWE
jgi:hypothetical protein